MTRLLTIGLKFLVVLSVIRYVNFFYFRAVFLFCILIGYCISGFQFICDKHFFNMYFDKRWERQWWFSNSLGLVNDLIFSVIEYLLVVDFK